MGEAGENRRDLTESQRRCLRALCEYIRVENSSPTLSELAHRLGLSHQRVAKVLAELEAEGLVTRRARKARTVRPTDAGLRSLEHPETG